jgi:hypothetical protein
MRVRVEVEYYRPTAESGFGTVSMSAARKGGKEYYIVENGAVPIGELLTDWDGEWDLVGYHGPDEDDAWDAFHKMCQAVDAWAEIPED